MTFEEGMRGISKYLPYGIGALLDRGVFELGYVFCWVLRGLMAMRF